MKKLSKRQKLIGGIAIILVAVILAIVITTNIVKNNNQVASEGYSATTANADSSLISNYILNGITIGGITGKMDVLDTSDATATPEDILWGETAYVDGKKITGTMTVHLRDVSGEETENTYAHDNLGNIVKVPAGFKVVNPEDNVTDGINNDVRCNIYDMAGNTKEWSTETCSNNNTPCVGRGGFFSNTSVYAGSRSNTSSGINNVVTSFRPILYL